jgi:hypothetical protein
LNGVSVYIGYDPKEIIAYHVLSQSILDRASGPVSIIPVKRDLVGLQRPRTGLESTEFSFSRFLVPSLHGPSGYPVFMDCDMLCLGDVYELVDLALAKRQDAVSVVQHNYIPRTRTKFLGQPQMAYPKKNWSSLMVFDAAHPDCRSLTREVVEQQDGLYLHQFKWTDKAGSLPLEWNWLAGEYKHSNKLPKLIHYTIGGPWFPEYRNCEYSELWWAEYSKLRGGFNVSIAA